MTEKSFLWTTGGAGDGATEYTRSEWSIICQILGAAQGPEGVVRGWRNLLAPSSTGINNARIGTGGAIVDGKPYDSTNNTDITIPTAVGGGNTRIDRIVLRAVWATQTVRIVRLPGTDAATPTVPARSTTSGTEYDILLCQALVNTSGVVTITDERIWADVVSSIPLTSLANSAAASVIGRAASTLGAVADIPATTNDRFLARVSNALSWVQLTIGMIPDSLITAVKLATNSVTAAKIAAGSVDDSKIGYRVGTVPSRLGGSATHWNVPGPTSYVPLGVKIEAGAAAPLVASGDIFFPESFSYAPVVIAVPTEAQVSIAITAVSATGFSYTITFHYSNPTTPHDNAAADFMWMAIGSE